MSEIIRPMATMICKIPTRVGIVLPVFYATATAVFGIATRGIGRQRIFPVIPTLILNTKSKVFALPTKGLNRKPNAVALRIMVVNTGSRGVASITAVFMPVTTVFLSATAVGGDY